MRDLDRVGGHIRGSLNIHAYDFKRSARKWATEWPAGSRVVFHCMYSQNRGPSSARALAAANEALKLEKPTVPYVLEGGFMAMADNACVHDVLEKFDRSKMTP